MEPVSEILTRNGYASSEANVFWEKSDNGYFGFSWPSALNIDPHLSGVACLRTWSDVRYVFLVS